MLCGDQRRDSGSVKSAMTVGRVLTEETWTADGAGRPISAVAEDGDVSGRPVGGIIGHVDVTGMIERVPKTAGGPDYLLARVNSTISAASSVAWVLWMACPPRE